MPIRGAQVGHGWGLGFSIQLLKEALARDFPKKTYLKVFGCEPNIPARVGSFTNCIINSGEFMVRLLPVLTVLAHLRCQKVAQSRMIYGSRARSAPHNIVLS